MANIIQTFPAGGGSGHTILDGDGTALAQEKNLQFIGFNITDDSSNEATEVAPVGLNTDDINDIANGEISNGFVQSQFNHSTEEQVVGKWIDGKPLYQITLVNTLSSAGDWQLLFNLGNKEIKYVSGYAIKNSGDFVQFGYGMYKASDVTLDWATWSGNFYVILWKNNGGTYSIYTTLKYTKTTD